MLVLAQYLDRSVNEALAPHGLSLGQFDILATLRRQGPDGRLTPTQLMRSVMLSSGDKYEVRHPELAIRLGTMALAITSPSEVAVRKMPIAKPRSRGRNHCEMSFTPAE